MDSGGVQVLPRRHRGQASGLRRHDQDPLSSQAREAHRGPTVRHPRRQHHQAVSSTPSTQGKHSWFIALPRVHISP
ncbi:hypothetical protein GW17_00040465 [Ensete ventricosum]|nr:hypothetical protein GW17_00040465 [Ensete ventricosum]